METCQSVQEFITDLEFNTFLSKHVSQIRDYFNYNLTNSIALQLLVVEPLNGS